MGCVQACSNEKTQTASTPVENARASASNAEATQKSITDRPLASHEEPKKQPDRDDYNYKAGDYLHSELIPATETDFDAAGEIRNVVRRRNPTMDLHHLRFYGEKITKKDLEPLRSPDAVGSIKNLLVVNLDLTDDDLDAIKELRLVKLDLYKDPVKHLDFLKGMKDLAWLRVGHTDIDSSGMQVLSSLHNLKMIDLSNTPIEDQDLRYLYGLNNLKYVDLFLCKLSPAAVQKLASKLPHCKIDTIGGIDPNEKKHKDAERDFFF